MLTQCATNVPAYREAWAGIDVKLALSDPESFGRLIPLLEKEAVRADSTRFLASDADVENLHVGLTSGSEGRPMRGFMDRHERMKCALDLWSRRRWWVPDLSPADRFVRFYAFRRGPAGDLITNDMLRRGNDLHLPLSDLSDARLASLWDAILAFEPRWMHGPATAITALARFAAANRLRVPHLAMLELNGEHVEFEHIAVLSDVFHCPVVNNYGCREFWTLGYTCPAGTMHVATDSVYLETIELDGVREVVVSSLRNLAWPLIRYRIGDLGRVTYDSDCPCGRDAATVLLLERGRKADVFDLADGQRINAIASSGLLRALGDSLGYEAVAQYQVCRVSLSHLSVQLRLAERAHGDAGMVITCLREGLRKIVDFGSVVIDIQVADTILPDPITGKHRDFVDLMSSAIRDAIQR
jgi:phenylacetate-CoA ligase